LKSREQFGKRLLPFANHCEVDDRLLQHPGVVRRDLRAAEDDAQLRPPLFETRRDPERPIDVPQVARKADHPGLASENLLNESAIAQGIRQAWREEFNLVEPLQPAQSRVHFQISGR